MPERPSSTAQRSPRASRTTSARAPRRWGGRSISPRSSSAGRTPPSCTPSARATPAARRHRLPAAQAPRRRSPPHDLKQEIRRLNPDPSVTGIMMHLPLPAHLDAAADAVRDRRGEGRRGRQPREHRLRRLRPHADRAVHRAVGDRADQVHRRPIRGAEAVVVGASEIAGKPIALLLTEQMATVTLCHIATKDLIAAHAAGGDPRRRRRQGGADRRRARARGGGGDRRRHQPRHAAGRDEENRRRRASSTPCAPRPSHITPVPGGVGPMTVAMLLRNTLRSAEILAEKK